MAVTNKALYVTARGQFVDSNPLANIMVLGVASQPGNVTLNGSPLGNCVTYDAATQRVTITGLQNSTTGGAWSQDWVLNWG